MHDMYIVKAGDTLYAIAKRSGTTVEELMKINNLQPHQVLMIGMTLYVPFNNAGYFDKFLVEGGDTLSKIAAQFKTTPEVLALVNGIHVNSTIYPGQLLMIPKKGVRLYLTEENETIEQIAKNMNATRSEIVEQNQHLSLSSDQMLMLKK